MEREGLGVTSSIQNTNLNVLVIIKVNLGNLIVLVGIVREEIVREESGSIRVLVEVLKKVINFFSKMMYG